MLTDTIQITGLPPSVIEAVENRARRLARRRKIMFGI